MAAGKWKLFHQAKLWLSDGTLDLDDATNWRVILLLSTSNVNDLTLASPILANITNQHANANGYTTDGTAVTPTWTRSAGTATFDSTDAQWTASVGDITARFAGLLKNATVNGIVKPVVALCLLDTTAGGTDVTATPGNTFTVQMSASGLWAASGADID